MTHRDSRSGDRPWAAAKYFLAIFVPLTGLLLIVLWIHYQAEAHTDRATRNAAEELNVGLVKGVITNDLKLAMSDLLFLSEQDELLATLASTSVASRKRLAGQLLLFGRKRKLYEQIQLLDRAGSEIARAEFGDGEGRTATSSGLQDLSGRPDFQRVIPLQAGQMSMSVIEKEAPPGPASYPPDLLVVIGTPVFDGSGRKQGVMLLACRDNKLSENFTAAASSVSRHIMLLNGEGRWLSKPGADDEWLSAYRNHRTFPLAFADAWQRIVQTESGQFQNADGLFTFTAVDPLGPMMPKGSPTKNHHNAWKIVSRVSPQALGVFPAQFFQRNSLLYIAMFILLAGSSGLLAYTHEKRKLAEAQRDYDWRFRNALENISLAAVILDPSGNIIFCNDCLLGITEWRAKQVIGRNWIDTFIVPEHQQETRTMLMNNISRGTFPDCYETEIQTRHGKRRLISWHNLLSFDRNGNISGLTCIGEDVTESRQSEEQLRKLSRAVEQSPVSVMITDTKGNIEYLNPKFSQLTGYALHEVIGRNPRLLKSGATSPDEYKRLWEAICAGGEWRGELHNKKKSGELYWESASISAIKNLDGVITHYLAVKEDITDRKRLEQQVAERNREIARTQTLAAIGQMAYMVAHDLRNPLSSIKMALQIFGKDPASGWSKEERELRQIALEQVHYMEEMLVDLLSYSRPGSLGLEWLTLDKVLDSAILLVQREVDEHRVQVTTHYQSGLPTVHADASKLRQAFSNLISNAVQATEGVADRVRKITVSTRLHLAADGPQVRVSIWDNGCGINPEQRQKLFEPFFTTRAKGTGLGLAIVKQIIDQHHGHVTLEPADQGGTCAIVSLPTGPQSNELAVNREPGKEVDRAFEHCDITIDHAQDTDRR